MIEKVTEWKNHRAQSCIIVGKCADHVLRNFNNVISVYIEAPRHACVDRICKMLNVTPKRAEELIKKQINTGMNITNVMQVMTGEIRSITTSH